MSVTTCSSGLEPDNSSGQVSPGQPTSHSSKIGRDTQLARPNLTSRNAQERCVGIQAGMLGPGVVDAECPTRATSASRPLPALPAASPVYLGAPGAPGGPPPQPHARRTVQNWWPVCCNQPPCRGWAVLVLVLSRVPFPPFRRPLGQRFWRSNTLPRLRCRRGPVATGSRPHALTRSGLTNSEVSPAEEGRGRP